MIMGLNFMSNAYPGIVSSVQKPRLFEPWGVFAAFHCREMGTKKAPKIALRRFDGK